MAEGFPNINTSITITNKDSGTSYSVTGEIFNFKEEGIKRDIEYKKVVSGSVIPKFNNPINYAIEFEFVLVDGDLQSIINQSSWYFNLDNTDKYLVQLDFSEGTNNYTKRYYDGYIHELTVNNNKEILEGKVRFSLPSVNLNGNETVFFGSDITSANSYNTTMGY